MTRIDRRSIIKAGLAAGLASCGGSNTAQPNAPAAPAAAARGAAAPAGAAAGNEFAIQFTGLFLCAYSPTNRQAFMAVPAPTGHSAHFAADLRHVDVNTSDEPDLILAGPGGQQIAVWKIKKKGEIALADVTGATIAPTAAADVTKCPGSDASMWQSVSWLADISRVQNTAVKLDKGQVATYLKLTSGVFGAVMPASPDAREQKFVVVDEQDKDVLNGNQQIIDQPLASAIFYRAAMDGKAATLTLPNGAKIVMTGVAAGGFQGYFSHLPVSIKPGTKKRRLDHFGHYFGLLANGYKKQYPGIGNPCGIQAQIKTRETVSGGEPNIEPIFCPPAYLLET